MIRPFVVSLFGLGLLCSGSVTMASIQSKQVEYREGKTVLEGVLSFDDAIAGPRPGVIVVHEWMGLNDYAKRRAQELAERGYVALAADIYGKGVRATTMEEASKLAGIYKGDRPLLRKRVRAALDFLVKQPTVDSKRVGAIGYCFGGTTVLELARSGAPVAGVVSFHGGLQTPNVEDAKKIRGKVLILHGADDPFVPQNEVEAFVAEMKAAKVDWQMISYGNTVHSFSSPDAGNDPSKGFAYNALADRRSFGAMTAFFDELFGTP